MVNRNKISSDFLYRPDGGSTGMQSKLFKELKRRYEYVNIVYKSIDSKRDEVVKVKKIELNNRPICEVWFVDGTAQRISDPEFHIERPIG